MTNSRLPFGATAPGWANLCVAWLSTLFVVLAAALASVASVGESHDVQASTTLAAGAEIVWPDTLEEFSVT